MGRDSFTEQELRQLVELSGWEISAAGEISAQAAVLAYAVRQAHHAPDDGYGILRKVSAAGLHPCLEWAYVAALEAIARCMIASDGTEFDVHRKLWSSLSAALPGAEKVSGPKSRTHIPDGWVSYGGDVIPVEVKKGAFTLAALRQINRYMREFGKNRAVAVASSFPIAMPPNIIQIDHTTIN
jgi:hypothetical protein